MMNKIISTLLVARIKVYSKNKYLESINTCKKECL